MKKLFSIVALLAFAGSVYAGCPSKPIHGKVVSFDVESKTLTVAQGKKEMKVQIGSKTKMEGIDNNELKSAKGARITIEGCNCKNKTASKIAFAKGKGKGKGKKG